MFESLKLSRVFWLSIITVYVFFIVAFYSLTAEFKNSYNSENAEQLYAAIKLTSVRFVGISIILIGYPFILLRNTQHAKYLTIALTVWVIAMYIDDHVVLYRMIEYSDRGLFALVQWCRPIVIISLVCMSIEFTLRPHPVD
ncbi:MAG: hypothetical protein HOI86_02160 [Tateyamaria sp.]|jgi:hypothetical protein|nr:hypothetical protein [Tateyamaria sp.]